MTLYGFEHRTSLSNTMSHHQLTQKYKLMDYGTFNHINSLTKNSCLNVIVVLDERQWSKKH